ncbi:ROK family protein [Sedimenticola sp.]|uniref:ROK family protein n=1 Tax=Sedimenticola sp. TaxID=1940285 RepID=UPI003D145036
MRIGVDLGGSKIEGIALDDAGRILAKQRTETPAGDYRATVNAVANMVYRLEQETGRPGSVGIGTPGSPSPINGLIRNANSTCLNGQPLQQDLEQVLSRPIRLANDADCFALSESTDGAGRDYTSVFGVILGTGVGAGVVIRGGLIPSINRIAGEWGHNPLPWPKPVEMPGERCYCGQRGCIETFLSGPGLSHDYRCTTGRSITAQALSDRLAQQEPAAIQVMARYEDRLARSLATVINILDPDAIVLGGGLSNLSHLYQRVPEIWTQYIFSDGVCTSLLPPMHGDSSGVRGAAWLWGIDEYAY